MNSQVLEVAAGVVAGVRPEQLDGPTPCSEWNVRALLNHMIGGNIMFGTAAKGDAVDPAVFEGDLAGNDPAGAYKRTAADAREGWSSPGAMERTVSLPIGDLPGSFGVTVHSLDHVVHAWDVARATGQAVSFSPEITDTFLTMAQGIPDDFRGEGKPFGPAVDAPEGAPALDRIAALLGRRC